MPGGVFKPYSGVSTAVLVFTKGGKTENVWFYEMKSDGYTLDDKRSPIDERGDIPNIIEGFQKRTTSKNSFFVKVDEIKKNDYKLSPSNYREEKIEDIANDDPIELISEISNIEKEISDGIQKLKKILKTI